MQLPNTLTFSLLIEMKNTISLSLVQFNPAWEDESKNIDMLDKLIDTVPSDTNLVILPEMFLTGFSMNVAKIAQTMDGYGVKWMVNKAIEKKNTIIGTLAINDNNKIYNRLITVNMYGEISWYNKRHLFRMGEEHTHFSAGNEKMFFKVNDVSILPLVCYDLRFPVWSRNVNNQYHLLVYVANWPEVRREAYLTLLKARAIENLCYVAAVNRVGTDGLGISYAGDSVIIDPKGNVVADLPLNNCGLINYSIDLNSLQSYREKFPAHIDADEFEIKYL